MSPSIAPPSPEALAELVEANAARFPEKAAVVVIGDDGESLRLPLLVGIPSGATKPLPSTALPVWSDLVALTMGAKRTGAETIGEALARDCILFPKPGILSAWEERWPAVVHAISNIVGAKIGMEADLVAPVPKVDGKVVPGAFLVGRPALLVTITAPSRAHYVALRAAVRREGADHVALLDDLIAACVKGRGVDELLVRHPGLALPLYRTVMRLAGEQAEAHLGEW